MFSSFSFHAETSPFWCDAFFTHTASIIQDFQAYKCRKSLPENSSNFFFLSHLVYMRMTIFCHSSFSPSCVFFFTSIVEEKHFPSERARNKWKFFPSRWCRSFSFRSLLRCRRIINGRKLRKLCNIFIKFFAVACNFYEMEKFSCCVLLRMERRRMEIKIKEIFAMSGGVKKFMKRELITSNLGCFFIFIQRSLE